MNHKQVLLLNIPKIVELDTHINHEIPKTTVKTVVDENKKLTEKQTAKPLTKIEAAIGKPSVKPSEKTPIKTNEIKPLVTQSVIRPVAKQTLSSTSGANNAPR